MRADKDAPLFQHLQADGPGKAERGSQPAGKVPAPAHVLKAAVAQVCGKIRVAGPGNIPQFFVVFGAGIAGPDEHGQRRAAGFAVCQAGEDDGLIRLPARRGIGRTAGSPARQKGPHFFHIHGKAGGQTVDDGANRLAVGLPKDRDGNILSDMRRHGASLRFIR